VNEIFSLILCFIVLAFCIYVAGFEASVLVLVSRVAVLLTTLLIAIFRKNRRHQSVFVTSEYTSSTTTTTTSRHLLQTHRCTKKGTVNSRCLATTQWERGAHLTEQP